MAYAYNWILLPAILSLGIASFYTDVKYQIIRNRYLTATLIYIALAYPYLLLTSPLLKYSLNYILINLLLAVSFGYILYHLNIWAAGDGKLFIIFSLLVLDFRFSKFFLYPCVIIFVNTNIIAILLLFIHTVYTMIRTRKFIKTKVIKEVLSQIGFSFLIIFSISWIIGKAIISFLPQAKAFHPFILFAFYAIFYRLGSKSPKRQLILIALVVASLIYRFIVQPQGFFNLASLKMTFFSTLKYAILFTVLPRIIRLDLGDPTPLQREQLAAQHVPYSPYLFIGTLIACSPLSTLILRLFIRGR